MPGPVERRPNLLARNEAQRVAANIAKLNRAIARAAECPIIGVFPESIMRCMACGGKMVLINAIEDWTMPVLGFERHAYMCSGCGNTEQLTAFNKHAKEKHDAEVVAILAPPPVAPTAPIENQRTAQGFLRRVLAKIRGQ
jgi:hypothetical protein